MSSFWSLLFFLKKVGNIEIMDIANKINICLPFNPTSVISIIVYPISKFIIFIGISPKKVPRIYTLSGMSAMGEAQLTIVFGKTGDILTKRK